MKISHISSYFPSLKPLGGSCPPAPPCVNPCFLCRLQDAFSNLSNFFWNSNFHCNIWIQHKKKKGSGNSSVIRKSFKMLTFYQNNWILSRSILNLISLTQGFFIDDPQKTHTATIILTILSQSKTNISVKVKLSPALSILWCTNKHAYWWTGAQVIVMFDTNP